MKHLRNYLALLVVTLLGTLTFIACDKDKDDDSDSSSDSIVGTWTRTVPDDKDLTVEFIFKADKTFTDRLYYKGAQSNDFIGIYCTAENVLTITIDTDSIKYREQTYIYSIDGDKLTLYTVAVSGVKDEDLDKEPLVFIRKK